MKPAPLTRPPVGRSEKCAVGALCALFALALGAHYGVSDQNVYLLPGIRLSDPGFLARDWYAARAVNHHEAFNRLVDALLRVGPLPWTSGAFHLLLKAGVAVSVYLTLRALYDRPLLPFAIAMPVLHLAVGNPRLLSHPFLVPWLIPSGIATALALAGVAALSWGDRAHPYRHAVAGALLGMSGVFHGTFLFLLPPFLAGVWVTLPGRFSQREIVAFGVPFLTLTLLAGWGVYARLDPGQSDLQRLDVLLRLRVPHHHLPGAWGWGGFSLFAKHAALGALGLALAWPGTPRSPVVLAVAASLAGLFVFLFVTTAMVFVPQVAILQPFHFVSLLSCFALLFFAGAVAQEMESREKPFSRQGRWRLAALAVGLVVAYQTSRIIGCTLAVLIVICLARAQVRPASPAHPLFVRRLLVGVAALFLTALGGFSFPLSTSFFKPYESDSGLFRWVREKTPPRILATLVPARAEYDLFQWVRTRTPRDAVFVVPPEMERFRLHAGRSLVVDWKGFPYRMRDAEEWYRRIVLESGVRKPAAKEEVLRGYLSLDAKRSRFLAREFGAQYVVVRKDRHTGDLKGLEEAYANDLYAVFKVGG